MSLQDLADFEIGDLDSFDAFDDFEECGQIQNAIPIYSEYRPAPSYVAVATAIANIDSQDSAERKRKDRPDDDENNQQLVHCKLPRPRILKRDFRRNFPMMWAHVFNSCDYDYMMQHLHTYYVPEVAMTQRDVRGEDVKCANKLPPGKAQYLEGIPYLAEFWFQAMNAAPDLVVTLKHTCLKVRSDGTSVIQCCFALTGTKIMAIPDPNDSAAMEKFAMYQAAMLGRRAEITQTAAALAAVAPDKAATVLRDRSSSVSKVTPAVVLNGAAVGQREAAVLVSDGSSDEHSLERYLEQPTSGSGSGGGGSGDGRTLSSSSRDVLEILDSSNCSVSELSDQFEALSDLDSVEHVSHVDTSATHSARGKHMPSLPTATNISANQGAARHTARSGMAAVGQGKKRVGRRPRETDWTTLAHEGYQTGTVRSSSEGSGGGSGSRDDGSVSSSSGGSDGGGGVGVPVVTAQQVVLTGAMDCICSIEMRLNADHKVTSMLLHYIT